MAYILKGDPKEVAKVIQENRIRVDRGVIEFTPCQPDSALDADSKELPEEDSKDAPKPTLKKTRSKKSE